MVRLNRKGEIYQERRLFNGIMPSLEDVWCGIRGTTNHGSKLPDWSECLARRNRHHRDELPVLDVVENPPDLVADYKALWDRETPPVDYMIKYSMGNPYKEPS